MAGETTELAKPVIGTSVPAPAKRTRELYRFSPVVSAAKKMTLMEVAVPAPALSRTRDL